MRGTIFAVKFAYLIEPPFNYKTDVGAVTGCDVELAKIILTRIGIESFEPIEAEFAELLPGVANGRWQMTTGLFATTERRQLAAFSRPIWALPDGLLIGMGNPKGIFGYQSIANNKHCTLAVIRDQLQHRSAVEFGISQSQIRVFENYTDAANSVLNGSTDAYASVERAHTGFLDINPDSEMEVVRVPASEKEPAFGSFGFSLQDDELRTRVDDALCTYLGSAEHRTMMKGYGFTDGEIDLVIS